MPAQPRGLREGGKKEKEEKEEERLARSWLLNTMQRCRMARDYNFKGFYALKGN